MRQTKLGVEEIETGANLLFCSTMKTKRYFDAIAAVLSLLMLTPLIVISWLLASITTQSNGLFLQKRVGRYGQLFTIFKIRTMHPQTGKISRIGGFLRKTKIDELPQLFNIIRGDMSFVGPRPDVSGYYDLLQGEDRKLLELRPGLTSEASIKYAHEEQLLNASPNPKTYNDTVLFPDKVKMNLLYYHKRSFNGDLLILFRTLFRSP